MKKKVVMIGVLIILLASFVIAQAPFQPQTSETALTLGIPRAEFIKKETPLQLNTHVWNSTTGLLVRNDSVSCDLFVLNNTGLHILSVPMNFSVTFGAFFYDINDSVFVQDGFHSFLIQCNTTTTGGFVVGSVRVTADGEDDTNLDNTSGIAAVLFLLFLAAILLVAPFVTNFTKEEFTNLLLKRGCLMIGVFFLVLGSAIVSTIVEAARLGVTQDILNIMRLIGYAGYISIMFFGISTIFAIIKMWREEQRKKRGLD